MSRTVVDRVRDALLAVQRQSWEQGVAGHALLDLGEEELPLLLAEAAIARQAADGRLGVIEADGSAVNGATCLELVRYAGRRTGEERWRRAAERQLGWLLEGAPRAGDGTLFHLVDAREVWADTVYMVLPALAQAGHLEAAVAQFDGHRARLHDPGSGLYAARWSQHRDGLVDPRHWGTGNGWVVAGIARALHLFPDWPGDVRARMVSHAHAVLDACLRHRRADGIFHDVVDDPGSFPEVNVAQMLAYGALTGVADGWLPASYRAVGESLLAAARAHVDAVGLVRDVCGSPDFSRPGTSAEAQAFHLLAHAAAARAGAR